MICLFVIALLFGFVDAGQERAPYKIRSQHYGPHQLRNRDWFSGGQLLLDAFAAHGFVLMNNHDDKTSPLFSHSHNWDV
jgi:hypothetical protein